jgi:hypothetical protein
VKALRLDVGGEDLVDIGPGDDEVRLPRGVRPSAVRIVGERGEREWLVPVESGALRVGAVVEQPIDFEDALNRMLDFPAPLDASDAEDDFDTGDTDDTGDPRDTTGPDSRIRPGRTSPSSRLAEDIARYPLQKAIAFLDRLGKHQSGLESYLVDDWLHHLEGALDSSFGRENIRAWNRIGVPFRAALLASGFKPPSMNNAQARRYRALVRSFAAAVEGA